MHQPNINHINDLSLIYTIIDYFVNGKIVVEHFSIINRIVSV